MHRCECLCVCTSQALENATCPADKNLKTQTRVPSFVSSVPRALRASRSSGMNEISAGLDRLRSSVAFNDSSHVLDLRSRALCLLSVLECVCSLTVLVCTRASVSVLSLFARPLLSLLSFSHISVFSVCWLVSSEFDCSRASQYPRYWATWWCLWFNKLWQVELHPGTFIYGSGFHPFTLTFCNYFRQKLNCWPWFDYQLLITQWQAVSLRWVPCQHGCWMQREMEPSIAFNSARKFIDLL